VLKHAHLLVEFLYLRVCLGLLRVLLCVLFFLIDLSFSPFLFLLEVVDLLLDFLDGFSFVGDLRFETVNILSVLHPLLLLFQIPVFLLYDP